MTEIAEKSVFIDEYGEEWDLCPVPGCEFCVCGWTGVPYCYPHSLEKLGIDKIIVAYETTHDLTWEEFLLDG